MQESQGNKQAGLSWSTPVQSPAPAQKPPVAPKIQVPPPKPASSSTKYITMAVLGVIAGILIAWAWSAYRSPKASVPAGTTATSTAVSTNNTPGIDTSVVPLLASGQNLTIVSPQTAGNRVAVAKAVVSSPTWIVIYENNAGKPGNALGAALFFPERQTGTVEMLRSTTSGKSYLAVQQVDNGDRKFSLKDDQFLTSGGDVQWVTFDVR